jgi:hypothetical protein
VNRFAFVLLLLPAVLSGQAMLSHGLAAGSGSLAGGMAGKQVSNVLNKVKGVGEVAEKAGAKPSPVRELKRGPVLTPVATVDHIASSHTSSRMRPAAMTAARQRVRPADPAYPVPPLPFFASPLSIVVTPALAPVIPGEASGEELRGVAAGSRREAVLGKLGIPASKVSIPEGGGMREIWYYTKQGDVSGTVRIVNGVVASVQVN